MVRAILLLSLLCGSSLAMESSANPIRKVVTLMQNMQKEIEAEGEKEKELNEKFVCYCSSTEASLTKTSEDGSANADQLSAKLKSETAEKSQITQELGDHKKDRESAKGDLEEATSLREKEAAEFASAKADSDTNIAGVAAAIPAIEKGMGGAALLQIPKCRKLRQIVQAASSMDAMDQRGLIAFLDQSSGQSDGSTEYAPGTGEILGILKQMQDEFQANLKEAVESENSAASGFASLKASKEKEIEVATEAIETKMSRAGDLAVSVVQTKDGLEDSNEEVAEAGKTLSALKKQCAAKEKEYSTACKERADEVAALSQAIGVLNDDDALDVFKKAVPAAMVQTEWTGFLQRSVRPAAVAVKAQAILAEVASAHKSPQLSLMLLTLNSKIRMGSKAHGGAHKFEEINKMIDDMVVLLGKQQDEDDKQKEWCREEFDKSADDEAAAKTELSRLESSLEEATDEVASLTDELAVLTKQVGDLDFSVAEATLQRKEEHAQFQETVQMQEAAVALINKAKKKLEKFYKPALVQKVPVKPKADDDFDDSLAFVQVRTHDQSWSMEDAADDSEVAVATTTVSKTKHRGGGVMALMDSIIHETEMAMKDAEFAEKEAQGDYGDTMSDAQAARAGDSKSITDKTAAKADLESKLVSEKEAHAGSQKQLLSVGKLIADLHAQCDFIVENYDMRKEARASESDSLKNAKAVLAGAK